MVWRRPPRRGAGTPLVILLHGRGADEHDLFDLADRLPHRYAYASVRAPIATEGGGYTWFESRAVARPVAASLRASVVWLRAWLDAAPEGYGRGACYLLGFSAGTMMAGALILDDPQRFAGAVLLSGAMSLGGEFPAPPGRLARMPIFYAHGTLDAVIPPSLITETISYLCDRSGAEVTRREYPHAHAISSREIDDIASWFER